MALSKKNKEKNEVLLHEGDGLMSAEALTRCKNSVCLIKCETKRPIPLLKRGTGFYAKARIFGTEWHCIVTNHHVLSCEADAYVGFATFNYEGENPGVAVQLQPDKVFRTNKELDYTVVGVNDEEIHSISPPVWPLNYVKQPAANVGDDVFIFQHPRGFPKQFSYEKIIKIDPPFVYYSVDTDDGSSGSPVLRKLHLMAIHHKGSKECGYNKGTLFSEIINDLHSGCYSYGKIGSYFDGFNDNEVEEHFGKRTCVRASNETHSALESGGLALTQDGRALLCPSDEVLDKLSHECSGFYKHLGRRLGVDNVKIEEISKDHVNYGSNAEKCFQVLQEWKQSEMSPVTYVKLDQALRSLKKNALANKYCSGRNQIGF